MPMKADERAVSSAAQPLPIESLRYGQHRIQIEPTHYWVFQRQDEHWRQNRIGQSCELCRVSLHLAPPLGNLSCQTLGRLLNRPISMLNFENARGRSPPTP